MKILDNNFKVDNCILCNLNNFERITKDHPLAIDYEDYEGINTSVCLDCKNCFKYYINGYNCAGYIYFLDYIKIDLMEGINETSIIFSKDKSKIVYNTKVIDNIKGRLELLPDYQSHEIKEIIVFETSKEVENYLQNEIFL